MPRKITERQREVLNYIEDYIDEYNRPPTISDIKKYFGFKSPQSVVDHLNALEKKSYIKRIPNSRGIVLLNEKKSFPILGKVAAGQPLASEELFDGHFNLSEFYEADKTFVLKVKGDSMKDVGIFEGDMVLIKSGTNVESGDIVVAVIDDEYTVKRFFIRKDNIELKPENTYYKSIIVNRKTEDFRIIGKVVGVHRVIK